MKHKYLIKYLFIYVVLLVSLFIYLFYRTEKTVVTSMLIHMISLENYAALKANILSALPLNDIIIYSLPEGLWILCITLTSKSYYIRFKNLRIDCVYIPLIFCVGLEFLQLFHITNGRFDLIDIAFCIVFWTLGIFLFNGQTEKHNIFLRPNAQAIVCLGSYCIVYLAHVFK